MEDNALLNKFGKHGLFRFTLIIANLLIYREKDLVFLILFALHRGVQ